MHGIWCKLKSDYHIRDATHVSGLWFTPGSLRLPLEWLVASKFDKFGYPDDTPALAFPPGRHPKPWEPVAFGMSEVARAAGLSVPRPVRRGLKAVRRWASFERGDGGEGGLSPRSRSPRAPRRRPRRSRSFESVLPRSAASSSRSTPEAATPPPPPPPPPPANTHHLPPPRAGRASFVGHPSAHSHADEMARERAPEGPSARSRPKAPPTARRPLCSGSAAGPHSREPRHHSEPT